MRSAVKKCPGCGRPIFDPGHAFCTMRCKDAHERKQQSTIEREVEALMRQYHEENWVPVRQEFSVPVASPSARPPR